MRDRRWIVLSAGNQPVVVDSRKGAEEAFGGSGMFRYFIHTWAGQSSPGDRYEVGDKVVVDVTGGVVNANASEFEVVKVTRTFTVREYENGVLDRIARFSSHPKADEETWGLLAEALEPWEEENEDDDAPE